MSIAYTNKKKTIADNWGNGEVLKINFVAQKIKKRIYFDTGDKDMSTEGTYS
jgi:hypothetical protein